MLRRPPQHRADATPIYVHSSDSAWDHDRITEERKAMKEAGEDPNTHPVWLYWIGATRYDLHARLRWKDGAAPVTDWLDLPNASRFTLRRLPPRLFSRVHPRIEAAARAGVDDNEIKIDACKWSVMKCEGPDAPELHGGHELTESDISKLSETFGVAILWTLGDAAYHCSVPLTEDEKKAFAS